MSDKSAIIKEAQRYIARGQIDKAIAEWEKVAKEYPDGNAFNTIGDLHLKKGNKPAAIDSFHKAANFLRQEGFALKALALYKKILNINPGDSDALYFLGELNEAKGLTMDAIKYYLASAESLSKEGKKERFFGIYEKILTLVPSNIPLRNRVAEIYTKEGLTAEAAKQHLHLARLYTENGDNGKAILYYQKALDDQPLDREAILELNDIYEKAEYLDQAVAQMKEAVSLFPQDTKIVLRCAEILIKASKVKEAKEYLKQVADIEPSNIKARRLLGDIYLKEGKKEKAWTEYLPVLDDMLLGENYDDAIKLLESFKDVDPIETRKKLVSLFTQLGEYTRVVQELVSLGDVFIEKGRQREALDCFTEALKMSPDDVALRDRVIELEKTLTKEHISPEAEKTVEEVIIEADIYVRYGLYDNAKDLLEAFREKEPDDINLHLRLRSLYVDTGDKEQAVSECLVLSDLYRKAGDMVSSEQIVNEALGINPDDPRLAGRPTTTSEKNAPALFEDAAIEEYTEEIAEADFYAKQGLIDEARAILERLHNLFPDDMNIYQKLSALGQISEGREEIEEIEETEGIAEMQEPVAFESELIENQEIAEPAIDGDVMDIFNEFKKGIDKELEEEDYETHYNLGIAYKEMGLIDDAIREFQASRKDPIRFVYSSNMLGVCYIEKGLFPIAIDVLKDAIDKMEDRGESYWAMNYELAGAYEKNGNLKEALGLYMHVYGWNSKFRSVSDKINQLKTSTAESDEKKKTKDRKDRVSYL
jgi:tetratricopeptide (TPR) repeat protein